MNRAADLLRDFPVRIHLPILWNDMDAFRHVNNAIYIKWFESSRLAYLEQAGLHEMLTGTNLGPILASIRCNYRRQLHYPDTVDVASRVSQLGRSSMVIEHAVASESQNEIVADGESVVVVFDYSAQRAVRIPENVRQSLFRLQGEISMAPTNQSAQDGPRNR